MEIALSASHKTDRVRAITKALGVKELAHAIGVTPSAVYRCHYDGSFPTSWREVVLHECGRNVHVAITEAETFSLFGMIRPKNPTSALHPVSAK